MNVSLIRYIINLPGEISNKFEVWLAQFLIKKVSINSFKYIRDDLLRLIRRIYVHSGISDEVDKGKNEIIKEGVEYWSRAPEFELNTYKVIPIIKKLRIVYWTIFSLSIILSLAISYNFLPFGKGLSANSVLDTIIAIVPWFIPSGMGLYLRFFRTNESLHQEVNTKLRIFPGKFDNRKSEDELFALLVWNKALNGPRIVPVLGLLLIVRLVSENLYLKVMNTFTNELIAELREMEGFVDLVISAKNEYQRLGY